MKRPNSGGGSLPAHSTVLRGELADEIVKLKQDVDGVILVAGSAALVQALLDHGLVDELRLMVFPVILGSGKRSSEKPPTRPLCDSSAPRRSAMA